LKAGPLRDDVIDGFRECFLGADAGATQDGKEQGEQECFHAERIGFDDVTLVTDDPLRSVCRSKTVTFGRRHLQWYLDAALYERKGQEAFKLFPLSYWQTINFSISRTRLLLYNTQLNRLQNKTGRKVWATLIWDRDIRSGKSTQVLWYVLNNPKKAGITDNVLSWHGNWWDERLEE
jgi:hypothetical protein